jgi:FKBP-type peptidyl-prolyl cis-trans isomerase FkpA
MQIRLTIVISLFIAVSLLSSCKEEKPKVILNENKLKKPLMDINKSKVRMENNQIDKYIQRRGWEIIKTGTGLRYYIYKKGTGALANEGQLATVTYTVMLLNGDTAYSTKETGPQEFLIGMDDVESGLHEGIQYMHVGDKAKLVLPSFLAHGLLGDQDKIPMRSTIIYDIELINLKD